MPNVEGLAVSDSIKNMITTGGWSAEERESRASNGKDTSRSAAVYAVACALVRADYSDAVIVHFILGDQFPISDHVREQKQPESYASRQVASARKEVSGYSPFVTTVPETR